MKYTRLLASCFVGITAEDRHRKETTDHERTYALFFTFCLFVKGHGCGDEKVNFCVMSNRLNVCGMCI
jgi:hypothetical protein